MPPERGAATDWYPYPFLNPANNGYTAVAITVFGLLLLTLALIWAVTRISGRAPHRQPETQEETVSEHGSESPSGAGH